MPFFYPKKPNIAVSLTILMLLSGYCGIVDKLDEVNENRGLIRKRSWRSYSGIWNTNLFGTNNFHRDYISLPERSWIDEIVVLSLLVHILHATRYVLGSMGETKLHK